MKNSVIVVFLSLLLCACDKYAYEPYIVAEQCTGKGIETVSYLDSHSETQYGYHYGYDYSTGEYGYFWGPHTETVYETKYRDAPFVYTESGQKFEVALRTYDKLDPERTQVEVQYEKVFKNDEYDHTRLKGMVRILEK